MLFILLLIFRALLMLLLSFVFCFFFWLFFLVLFRFGFFFGFFFWFLFLFVFVLLFVFLSLFFSSFFSCLFSLSIFPLSLWKTNLFLFPFPLSFSFRIFRELGSGYFDNTSYFYEHAQQDQSGWGFLGFGSVTAVQLRTGLFFCFFVFCFWVIFLK